MNKKQISGKFLADLRRKKGFTQAELSLRLGVSERAVSRWETGKFTPRTAQLEELSRLYSVTMDEILLGRTYEDKFEAQERVLKETLNENKKLRTISLGFAGFVGVFLGLLIVSSVCLFALEKINLTWLVLWPVIGVLLGIIILVLADIESKYFINRETGAVIDRKGLNITRTVIVSIATLALVVITGILLGNALVAFALS